MAADHRVFKYIRLPEGFEAIHLPWIPPEKGETLAAYAKRMAEGIDNSVPFIVAGLSMGGMIASEISALKPPVCTILISSIPDRNALPAYYKWAGYLKLPALIPIPILKAATKGKRLFTKEVSADKILLKQIIDESDNSFIKWAMMAILQWDRQSAPGPFIHIHGDKDIILPIKYTQPTHIIKGAGHLLVMTHGRQVNRILAEILPKVI